MGLFGYIPKAGNQSYSDKITVLHTVQAAAYADAAMIGVAMQIPLAGRLNNGRALLVDIHITDVAKVLGAVDFEFFAAQPTTGADRSALNITKTSGNSLALVKFTTGFTSSGGYNAATQAVLNNIVKAPVGASSIWYVMTNRKGSSITFSGTANLEVAFGFSQE